MVEFILALRVAVRVSFRSRSDLALEVPALRQQVAVMKRKRPRPAAPNRHMSAATRKRIADAQRARWAEFHAKRSKRDLSPQGRRRLSEPARARWAASRKAHGDSLGPVRLLSKKEIAATHEEAAKARVAKAGKARGA